MNSRCIDLCAFDGSTGWCRGCGRSKGSGIISSKRGRVIILDHKKLEELAGDSYGPAESQYRRLIGPFGRSEEVI